MMACAKNPFFMTSVRRPERGLWMTRRAGHTWCARAWSLRRL